MTRARVASVIIILTLLLAVPLAAYLKLGTRLGERTVTLQWRQQPIRYFVSNRGVDGVSAQQFQMTIARAFQTWHDVETAETASEFVGFTSALPFDDDSMSVLGFVSRPEQDRVLGATTFLVDTVDGRIVESDIFFNSTFPWSTDAAGVSGRFDLESIAVHEIGHFLGLSHSALGETEMRPGGRRVIAAQAVMFPIAFSAGSIEDRQLKADDIAGISDIYGTSTFSRQAGSISGRVIKGGQGVVGAHIIAFSPRTGQLISGFSLSDDGSFVIAGLEPGPYVLRAEPLDDAEIDSFFDESLEVDIDFQVKFHDRVVVVPRGGGTRDIEITVVPK